MPKYAIIDVETTGGTARFERITEIAIVLHDGQQVLDSFSTLINPERSIPWNIIQLTGITDLMVADAPKFFEVAKQIVQMTEDAIFVAHNVSFDYNFVREEFARLGYDYSRKQLCTVRLARKIFPGLKSYSLSNLKAHFGIYSEKSHRALDDTLATVALFERMLSAQETEKEMRALVHHGVRETKLPPSITLDRLHAIPEACGVYYFHDTEGRVLYVGKSLNIRKRLFEHFADQTTKGEKLRTGVADLSFEVTGSELVALLLESAEIKRLQPPVNRAQRITVYQGVIYSYTDEGGYSCLLADKRVRKLASHLQVVASYPKLSHARNHLESVVRKFELCHRLCHLDTLHEACFQYAIKQCKGACVGKESPEDYNARVSEALSFLSRGLNGTFVVIDEGRTPGEKAVVAVSGGKYKGYGFIEADLAPSSVEEFIDIVRPGWDDPEAARIIRGFVAHQKRGVRVVEV